MLDLALALALLATGVAIAAVASRVVVQSSTALATRLGLSQVVIGPTVVAVGTDLPEMGRHKRITGLFLVMVALVGFGFVAR